MKSLIIVLLALFSFPVQPQISGLDNGLIAYYNFNKQLLNSAGTGFNGISAETVYTKDRFGKDDNAVSINFKRMIECKDLNIGPDIFGDLTIAVWVKPVKSRFMSILTNDKAGFGRSLFIDPRGGGMGYSVFAGTGRVLGYVPVIANVWTLLVATYSRDLQLVTLHVKNSVTDTLLTGKGVLPPGLTSTYIGGYPNRPDLPYEGDIDDVRIYKRILNDNEIAALYDLNKQTIQEKISQVSAPTVDAKLFKGTGVIKTRDTSWQYVAFNEKEGSLLAVKMNSDQSAPAQIMFMKNLDAPPFMLDLNSNGKSFKGYFDKYTFIYTNFRNDTCDLGIIKPDNTTEIKRGVPLKFPVLNKGNNPPKVKLMPDLKMPDFTEEEVKTYMTYLTYAGTGIAVASCVVGSAVSGGLALIPCASAICDVLSNYVYKDDPGFVMENESANAIGLGKFANEDKMVINFNKMKTLKSMMGLTKTGTLITKAMKCADVTGILIFGIQKSAESILSWRKQKMDEELSKKLEEVFVTAPKIMRFGHSIGKTNNKNLNDLIAVGFEGMKLCKNMDEEINSLGKTATKDNVQIVQQKIQAVQKNQDKLGVETIGKLNKIINKEPLYIQFNITDSEQNYDIQSIIIKEAQFQGSCRINFLCEMTFRSENKTVAVTILGETKYVEYGQRDVTCSNIDENGKSFTTGTLLLNRQTIQAGKMIFGMSLEELSKTKKLVFEKSLWSGNF